MLALRQTVVFPLTLQPLAINRPHVDRGREPRAGGRPAALPGPAAGRRATSPSRTTCGRSARSPPSGRWPRRPTAASTSSSKARCAAKADGDRPRRTSSLRATVAPLPEAERAHARGRRLRPAHPGADRPRAVAVERPVAGAARAGARASTTRCGSPTAGEPARHQGRREAADPRSRRLDRQAEGGGRRAQPRGRAARAEGQDRVRRGAGDDRRAAAVLSAPAAQGDSGRARRGRKAGGAGDPQADRRREAARRGGRDRQPRSRPARAHDAGLARVPDDPHLHRLGARRALVGDHAGSARSGRGARGARPGPLRSRQGQGADRRVPRGPEAEVAQRGDAGRRSRARSCASSGRPASARPRSASRSRAR